jgi:hypothetical protein
VTLTCKTCNQETASTAGGECFDCHSLSQEAWLKKMAIRQDPSQFNLDKLIRVLLDQHWMHECKIVQAYMPPRPDPGTRPTCQVHYHYPDGTHSCLRYSKGPLQGYFWDFYGEDFHSPELALIAITRAPAPTRVGTVIPTHGT